MQELQRFRGRGVGLGSYIVCTSFPGVPKTQIIPKFGHQLYNNKYLENTNATDHSKSERWSYNHFCTAVNPFTWSLYTTFDVSMLNCCIVKLQGMFWLKADFDSINDHLIRPDIFCSPLKYSLKVTSHQNGSAKAYTMT